MEIHHHPIAIGSHTTGKKWTHYLWEFLMLFLAVFCGFLAENQREHYIEKQREKKFISRLLSDLSEDTAFYKSRIVDLERFQKKTDAFVNAMTGSVKPTDYQVLSAFVPMLYNYDVQVTTATYDQMKASGSLRYIHDDELTNGLQKYYEILIPRTLRSPAGSTTFFMQSIAPYVTKHFKTQDMIINADTLEKKHQVILSRTPESDQELINLVVIYGDMQYKLIGMLIPAMKKAQEIIEMIREKYHLK